MTTAPTPNDIHPGPAIAMAPDPQTEATVLVRACKAKGLEQVRAEARAAVDGLEREMARIPTDAFLWSGNVRRLAPSLAEARSVLAWLESYNGNGSVDYFQPPDDHDIQVCSAEWVCRRLLADGPAKLGELLRVAVERGGMLRQMDAARSESLAALGRSYAAGEIGLDGYRARARELASEALECCCEADDISEALPAIRDVVGRMTGAAIVTIARGSDALARSLADCEVLAGPDPAAALVAERAALEAKLAALGHTPRSEGARGIALGLQMAHGGLCERIQRVQSDLRLKALGDATSTVEMAIAGNVRALTALHALCVKYAPDLPRGLAAKLADIPLRAVAEVGYFAFRGCLF